MVENGNYHDYLVVVVVVTSVTIVVVLIIIGVIVECYDAIRCDYPQYHQFHH